MMDRMLNIKDRFEERKFIITSTIRMLALLDFSKQTLLDMYQASKKLREVEEVDATVTDDTIFEWFTRGVE